MSLRLTLAAFFVTAIPTAAVEPWATYRGNNERTGCTDGKPGPAQPKVLWSLPSKEHYVASPVVAKDRLFVSSLGAFNVAHFSCLDTDAKSAKRTLWTKSTPYLKLPVVSSPAVGGGRIIFGDGMHQTDGAVLHCLQIDSGLPLWQLPVPGKLVHLEGGPTVANGKVYIGGGAAGVLCVDLDRVMLQGKEMTAPEIQKLIAKRWQELLAKYEEEKKKDPDFAVPPSEDQLPRPSPRRLWQQGQERWHVDAPVAVVGERVLVASAFLDKERVGERALFSLDAAKGTVKWKAPLKLNPWGGPSVSGEVIVVGGSSIGYDPAALKGAKGELTALDLTSGKVLWRKDLKGGIVGAVAIGGGAAVCTASDGKVRAYDLKDGSLKWFYEAKAPLFASPAVAGGVVYAGDLAGVLHAIDLTTGQGRWTLEVGPAMIYGGPVLEGGRIYVATCNLGGAGAGKATGVWCVGEK